MTPTLHPRYFNTEGARYQLTMFVLDWQKEHGLTYAEVMGLLAAEISAAAKYAIRQERHPEDPEKKGDEA